MDNGSSISCFNVLERLVWDIVTVKCAVIRPYVMPATEDFFVIKKLVLLVKSKPVFKGLKYQHQKL